MPLNPDEHPGPLPILTILRATMNYLLRNFLLCFACVSLLVSTPALAQQDTEGDSTTEKSGSEQELPEISIDLPLEIDTEEDQEFLFDGGVPESLDQLRDMETRFQKLTEQLMPATVNIQMGASQGSGVVVTEDGYILTAAHVIGKPNQRARIVFPDGRKFQAKTLGVNSGRIDSGMLKIINPKNKSFPYVQLGISETLKLGQWVMAIGHPGGIDESRGLVTRVGRIVSARENVIRTDCTLVGGDSGGPLFDMNGQLIGIHSRIGSRLSDNYHVPVDQYSDNWDKLADGLILNGRPSLGFDVVGQSNVTKSVKKNSAAAKAGLETGDAILKIEDKEVADKAQMVAAISELKLLPNQKITIRIQREDEEQDLDFVVGRR